jgi:Big-like domain-containing protein
MRRHISRTLALASTLFLLPLSAQAALQRVGPVDPANGYPLWYQDTTGLTLNFCSPTNLVELNSAWCLILPPATAPETFPAPFFNEHFYWAAGATVPTGATRAAATALLTLSVEAAFLSGPVIPGDQMTFGRMRIVIPNIPQSGTYTIYHPFGVWVFPGLIAGQKLFYTEDVGPACARGVFDCALATPIGPFLLPSATQGGVEVPPIPLLAFGGVDPFYSAAPPLPPGVPNPFGGGATPYPGAAGATSPKYIADPVRLGYVTGSPLPPFVSAVDGIARNHNTFRIEVTPTGSTVPQLLDESPYFTLTGRMFEGAIPGAVNVERASYTLPAWSSTTAAKLDVYATAFPATQARIPAGPSPQTGAAPALVFWDAPCTFAIDPVTGLPTGAPIGPPIGTLPHQMIAAAPLLPPASPASNYWGQSAPLVTPAQACIAQTNAVGAGGAQVSVYYAQPVVDEVDVTSAQYDPTTTNLSVTAASSDSVNLPALTLFDFGLFVNGTFTAVTNPLAVPPTVSIPPATVRVQSAAGGVTDFQTATGVGAAAAPKVPVAANDMVTMFEDCSATPATACAVPQAISPLANDTIAGAPIVYGGGVTLQLVAAPRLGTVSYLDAVTGLAVTCVTFPCTINSIDGSILYTPGSNLNGTDGFAYTVAVTDPVTLAVSTSNIAGISVVITPVNDPPVANPDTANGIVNLAASIDVLANDTDPDGFTDIVAVANLTQPVGPVGAIATATLVGRLVNFTANTAGTYTFTYQAQDSAAALSNVATVTITVAGAEVITITPPALYKTTQARWTISGTCTPAAGQILTIQYLDGPNAGFIIGHVIVPATGAWLYDVKGLTGIFNPTTAGAKTIWVTGPGGGSATMPITAR